MCVCVVSHEQSPFGHLLCTVPPPPPAAPKSPTWDNWVWGRCAGWNLVFLFLSRLLLLLYICHGLAYGGQPWRVSSFLLPCGLQGLNSEPQVCTASAFTPQVTSRVPDVLCFVFPDRASLCGLSYPGIHCVDKASFKLGDPAASVSGVLAHCSDRTHTLITTAIMPHSVHPLGKRS